MSSPEKRVRTSGSPSRYQMGDRRYMGGQIRKALSGDSRQAARTRLKNSLSTGSTLWPRVEDSAEDEERKFEMQDTIQTLDSSRTERRHSAKTSTFSQGSTWQLFMGGRSRQFVGFMWRITFESPMIEKIFKTPKSFSFFFDLF